jgi:hypothetical protein
MMELDILRRDRADIDAEITDQMHSSVNSCISKRSKYFGCIVGFFALSQW